MSDDTCIAISMDYHLNLASNDVFIIASSEADERENPQSRFHIRLKGLRPNTGLYRIHETFICGDRNDSP